MADADLAGLVPPGAREAFGDGDDRAALSVLRHARDARVPGSVEWALLERLVGLVLIHMLREVEGTFALERADAVLDARGVERPDLEALR
ncbi:hypothetical protein [Deinococcus pimensis]|uniref:hypothetical protein n=1 Tax=Deinococcus pimensis TaxID=309888 RepID=UPI00047F2B96|nr:hypothetical protein [Deinococcus pimensis]